MLSNNGLSLRTAAQYVLLFLVLVTYLERCMCHSMDQWHGKHVLLHFYLQKEHSSFLTENLSAGPASLPDALSQVGLRKNTHIFITYAPKDQS